MKKRLIQFGVALAVVFVFANGVVAFLNRGQISVSELQVGDCLEEFYEQQERAINRVLCSVDHVQEVVGVISDAFSQGIVDFPDEVLLEQALTDNCVPAFTTYTGDDYENSDFKIVGVHPNRKAWDSGQRNLICIAERSDKGLIEGSLEAFSA